MVDFVCSVYGSRLAVAPASRAHFLLPQTPPTTVIRVSASSPWSIAGYSYCLRTNLVYTWIEQSIRSYAILGIHIHIYYSGYRANGRCIYIDIIYVVCVYRMATRAEYWMDSIAWPSHLIHPIWKCWKKSFL